MEKIKKIAKYTTNILGVINALILVLDPIWHIPFAGKISATIVGIAGVIGGYLLGSKTVDKIMSKGSVGYLEDGKGDDINE